MEETTTTEPSATVEATVTNDAGETITETSYADGTFKSISELEKGYTELRSSYSKKLGGFDGSPEEYTRAEGINESDPLYNYATTWGKDNQMNDTKLNDFVEGYNKQQQESYEQQTKEYQTSQIEALGENGQERIKNVVDYLKANTAIEQEGIDQLNGMFVGAKGIEVLESLIKGGKQSSPTQSQTAPSIDKDQINAMRFAKDENGNRRMSVDPTYRKKVEQLEQNNRKS